MEAVGATASIVGIIDFGLKLGVTLQTYVEAVKEAEERLGEIAVQVSSTAAALKELHDLINSDTGANTTTSGSSTTTKTGIFNDGGLKSVQNLAIQCKKIYTTIVILVKGAESTADQNRNDTVPKDMTALSATGLSLGKRLRWPWLEPRIKRCETRLQCLKLDLLLHLQIAVLARFQIQNLHNTPERLEEEEAIRAFAIQLRANYSRYIESFAQAESPAEPPPPPQATTPPDGPGERRSPTAKGERSPREHADNESIKVLPIQVSQRLAVSTMDTSDGLQIPGSSRPEPQQDRTPRVAGSQNVEVNAAANGDLAYEVDDGISTGENVAKPRAYRAIFPWLRSVFHEGSQSLVNSFDSGGSGSLEAFIYSGTQGTPLKLPFDSHKLHKALETIRKAQLEPLWERYLALTPDDKGAIKFCIKRAKDLGPGIKMVEDFQVRAPSGERGENQLVVFLKVFNPTKLVRISVEEIARIDVPLKHCRTMEMMKQVISPIANQAFSANGMPSTVDGSYRFRTADGVDVPKQAWKEVVRPGTTIEFASWQKQRREPLVHFNASDQGGMAWEMDRNVYSDWDSGGDIDHVAMDGPDLAETDDFDPAINKEVDDLLDLHIDLAEEVERSKLGLDDLLSQWTNAPEKQSIKLTIL